MRIHQYTDAQAAGQNLCGDSLLPGSLRLSINISPLQLADETLPGQIAAVAERGGFLLDRLTVEMTQSALLDDLSCAQAVAGEMKAMHCRLALDNFGTGHSSLFHLQALPFDELKIDRSFVHAVGHNRDSRKIASALINLAKNLGMITVAEGVETEEQAAIMNDLGCDLAQGWLFGRPLGGGDSAHDRRGGRQLGNPIAGLRRGSGSHCLGLLLVQLTFLRS